MNKQTMLCVTGIIFLFASAGFSGTLDVDFTRHARGNAALRSALIPGWGQVFNRQTLKGEILGTVFFASIGGYFYYTGVADEDYRDYEKQGLRNGPLYSDYETHKQQAINAVSLAAVTWVIAVVDAYVFGSDRREAGDQQLSSRPPEFQVAWLDSGASLRWKRHF